MKEERSTTIKPRPGQHCSNIVPAKQALSWGLWEQDMLFMSAYINVCKHVHSCSDIPRYTVFSSYLKIL